jgi:hypothetical protein
MTTETGAPAVNGTAPPAQDRPRTGAAVAVRSDARALTAKIGYARELANSGLLPAAFRRNPANVLFAVEYGDMLGLAPMAAITGIHVIEGKPSASAGLISALVRRAGHKLRITGDARSATCQIVRCDDPEYTFEVTFTIDDAKTAGLTGKDVWKKYGASMLKARAITQCARDACEEALFGLHYTPEELGAEVDEEGHVVGGQIVDGDAPAPQQPAGDAADGESWYVRTEGDGAASLDALLEKASAFGTENDGQKLWRETAGQHRKDMITADDRARVELIISARIADLRKAAEGAGSGVVDAEVVEGVIVEGLDPADDWAVKVKDIISVDDAVAAAADVKAGMKSGSIAKDRGERILAAIEVRTASLSGQAAA